MIVWPIFVLSLPGDDARRAPLLEQLAHEGLSAEIFFGIDGRHGLPPHLEAQIDRAAARRRMGRDMTDGEFACALSHRMIHARIVDEGLPGAIILEDDTILRPGFAALAREPGLAGLKLVLIDYAYGRAVRFSGRQLGKVRRYRLAASCTMANAYFVNAEGAQALCHAASPVSACADWPCCLYEVGAWALSPRLATHEAPGPGRMSHLDAQRDVLPASASVAQAQTLRQMLRRRLSVRIGRARGQR